METYLPWVPRCLHKQSGEPQVNDTIKDDRINALLMYYYNDVLSNHHVLLIYIEK